MRIKEISVKKLFGMFDHTIPLNMEDRVTVIIGPNGYGKTSLLRLINAVLCYDPETICQIPFEEFRIDFEDSTYLKIAGQWGNPYLPFIFFFHFLPNQEPERFPDEQTSNIRNTLFDGIRATVDSGDSLIELPKGGHLNFGDLFETKIFSELQQETIKNIFSKQPQWLLDITKRTSSHFIKVQRLLKLHNEYESWGIEPEMISVVQTYSEEMAQIIEKKLAESVELSQKLDSSFPSRLLNQNFKARISDEELREKLKTLQYKRKKLMSAGLLDKEEEIEIPGETIDSSKLQLLSLYVSDVEKKLGVFDDVSNRIELMKNMINNHFEFKEMSISKKEGFVFTNSNNVILSPSELSSGEQHLLIFLYELLFKVSPGTLILIDEPELSMHIAWQMEFINDLKAITKLSDLDFILATHSPDIINDNWDLTVELKGEY